MKITVTFRSEKEVEACDYREAMQIDIDGEKVFSVFDGDPEDANLSRDFSDVFSIPALLQRAYTAGKNNELFELKKAESDKI